MTTITDKRTLRGMTRAGHIVWPVKLCGIEHRRHSYVDQNDDQPSRFVYKGKAYWLRYFDGCFFPFVTTGDQS